MEGVCCTFRIQYQIIKCPNWKPLVFVDRRSAGDDLQKKYVYLEGGAICDEINYYIHSRTGRTIIMTIAQD